MFPWNLWIFHANFYRLKYQFKASNKRELTRVCKHFSTVTDFEQALTFRAWSLNLAQKICQAYMKYLETFFEYFRLFMLNIINIMKLVQNHQWKHQNNMWNLFKVNNKDVSELLLVSLLLTWNIHCSCVSIVKFKQVNTGWDGSCPSFLL